MKNIRTLLWSSRPVSWINTAFPFVAGYLFIAGTEVSTYFWVAAFYFLIPYNILIYVVNDVYDYESDMLNPRKGGVEGAILDKKFHPYMLRATAIVNIPFVAYLLTQGGLMANIVLVLCVINAAAYSIPVLRFKERPVVDSVSSSLHFVGPLLYVATFLGWQTSVIPFAVAFFFWGMASHAFGAVQDIIPDRKAKINSIATFFGAQATVRLSLTLYCLAVALVATQGWPAVIVAAVGLAYPAIVSPYINLTDKQSGRSNNGWKHFMKINQLVGFCVTILLILHLT